MKVDYFDKNGKLKKDKFDLSGIFIEKPKLPIVSQYVYVYLSNQRKSRAKAKNRGEVSGGGKKPWRQKGTGRARAGSNRSPLWKGGGVTFGPTGNENHKKILTKKFKKLAFRTALTLKKNNLVVTEEPAIKKSSEGVKYIQSVDRTAKKLLLIQNDQNKFQKLFKNIPNIKIVRIGELNTYDIVTAKRIIFFDTATEDLKNRCK